MSCVVLKFFVDQLRSGLKLVNRTPALPLSKIAVQEEHLASSLLHPTESTHPFRRPHEREKTNRLYAAFCRETGTIS